ncbi:MAG: hypothetical protein R3F20_13605 [Planctomycetota bacterium]
MEPEKSPYPVESWHLEAWNHANRQVREGTADAMTRIAVRLGLEGFSQWLDEVRQVAGEDVRRHLDLEDDQEPSGQAVIPPRSDATLKREAQLSADAFWFFGVIGVLCFLVGWKQAAGGFGCFAILLALVSAYATAQRK